MLLGAILGRALVTIAQTFSTIDTTDDAAGNNYGYGAANELLLNDGDGAFSAADDFSSGDANTNAVAMGDGRAMGETASGETASGDGPSPPSPPSSAGDDPTFVGADGLPYEVRGEPWKYFNLLSTPRLSLNAQFLPVPERFVHGKITDTVLGTLHLALCDAPRSRIVGVTFDVFNGAIGCTVRSPDEAPGSSEQTPCANVLPLAGVAVTEEPSMCNMATGLCGFVPPELNLTAFMATNPALVRVHMVRYNVSVAGANLSLVRDVVDRPPTERTQTFDCGSLAAGWGRARRACELLRAVLRREAPVESWQALPNEDRVATLARLTDGNTSRQLFFYNALIEALPYAQGDVHGLLGQRSVSPSPMRAAASVAPNPLGALALSTAQLQAANGAAGGGSAGTLQVAIDADGHHQGEGEIEGLYRDYRVRYISSHGPGAHTHSRFVCGAAAGSAASVEA